MEEETSHQPMHSLMGEDTSTPSKIQGKTKKTIAKKLMPRKKQVLRS